MSSFPLCLVGTVGLMSALGLVVGPMSLVGTMGLIGPVGLWDSSCVYKLPD